MSHSKTILLFCSIPFLVAGFLFPWYFLFSKIFPILPPPTHEVSREMHEVQFNAVGDIMLSRTVAQKIKNANNPFLPFEKMSDRLLGADFNFGNLETPITTSDEISEPNVMIFNTPEKYAAGLKRYRFDILNLANNHAFDQEKEGLFSTLNYLKDSEILSVGAGKTIAEAWKPKIIEKNGIKICFVGASYASINDNGATVNEYVARMDQLTMMENALETSKKICDFTIMSMHAGIEYTRLPTEDQTDFAHAAIDAGADIVIGAHPHWVQTIELYCPHKKTSCEDPKYIFYSLGNFIFDQEFSQDTKEGLMVEVTLQTEKIGSAVIKKSPKFQLIPVVIEHYSTPRLANELESANILSKIGETNKILP